MENKNLAYPIQRKWILGVFIIIPLVLAVGLYDYFLNDQAWQPYFSLYSLLLPLYLLFFELPHILASFAGFADGEYARHYRKHLLIGLPVMLLLFGVFAWHYYLFAIGLYLAITIYHVIRQQTGIAHMFGVPKGRWHSVWSWSIVIGGALLFMQLVESRIDQALAWLWPVGTSILAIGFIAGVGLIKETKSRLGVWYVVATLAMVLTSFLFVQLQYAFLAVLVVRFVHEVTAFMFYITHEMNRNAETIKNKLYKWLPLLPVSLVIVIPLFAIFGGAVVRNSISDPKILYMVVMSIALIHYYMESIMWKRDSLHRQYVQVV
ncbi:MAG: hypothetical protein KC877_01265 [Candidatus Kaiserbacteria bacterium]|nr:hypothetical protein [Candidatus Kaiserbacteria bacterium]MCB9816534.1 hypothetical protein [Candidatus Nomurabacteria bacterium]